MIKLIKKWIGDSDIILFGAGTLGQKIIKNWPFTNRIIAVIDNRVEKQKYLFHSKPVIGINKITGYDLDKLKIIITTDDRYYKQAVDQLASLGLIEGENFIYGYNLDKVLYTSTGSMLEPYEEILPKASYAPWRVDSSFIDIYDIVRNNTLIDIYRCFEIWELIKQVSKLDEGALIEIGVWRGGSGALICKQAANCRIKEKVFLCDTFDGVVKASEKDTVYKGGEHQDTSTQIVESLLDMLDLHNYKILKGVFPEDTAKQVIDLKFRFCHIDVDVYNSAKDIIEFIWSRMVIGGIILFDDYGFQECDGITKYVNKQKNMNDRIVIHNINGHAIIIKIN